MKRLYIEGLEVYTDEICTDHSNGCIVFVHGICHGGWCWKNFIDLFSEQGYKCYAVSLKGHGGSRSTKWFLTLKKCVENVRTVVEYCTKETRMKPFVVGHSMGGAVLQKYIGMYADTLEGAVLFAPATAPRMAPWAAFLNGLLKTTAAAMIPFKKKLCMRADKLAFFIGEDKFGNRVNRVTRAEEYKKYLETESRTLLFNMAWPFRYTKNYKVDIPILVLGSSADLYFPEGSLKKTTGKYQKHGSKKIACVILNRLCHDMMLDDEWAFSAPPVLEFAENPTQMIKEIAAEKEGPLPIQYRYLE